MKIRFALPLVFLAGCVAHDGPHDNRLLTVAERSGFNATARYDEVMNLCRELDKSPSIELLDMGRSVEGRSIPLLVCANPPVRTPEAAAASGKLVVMAFGNIHAGEVCGKEALLMLARELSRPHAPLLDDLIVLLAPIYNTDGNERVSPDNRPGQNGPTEGMGQRANAAGLDLNRDWVKVAAPETRASLEVYNTWDPAVIVDTHTTNGSWHRLALTYAAPRHPATHASIIEFTRETMLPDVTRRVAAASGYDTFFYGNFNRERTRWTTYPAGPRFGTPYRGLRNRIGILSEAYAYATYEDRVRATLAFTRECFEYAARHHARIARLIADADDATASATPGTPIAITSTRLAFDERVTIPGYVGEGDAPQDYTVEHHGLFVADRTVPRAFAYLVPEDLSAALANLHAHGVRVEALNADIDLDVEVDRVTGIERAERPFQGRHQVTVASERHTARRQVPAGTRVVRTAQPLGNLVAMLLEPGTEDGLVTWGFFDDALVEGQDFPVMRLPQEVVLDAFAVAPQNTTEREPVTFETVYGRGRVDFGGRPAAPRWLPDGEHYVLRKQRVHAVSGDPVEHENQEAMVAALAALEGVDEEVAERMVERARRQLDDTRTAAFLTHDDDLYYLRVDGSVARRLTHTPDDEEELASFAPGGRHLAFVRDDNLFFVDVQTGAERAITDEHTPHVRNGKNDWVYFEELYGRSWRGYWWSQDGAALAFFRFDDAEVDTFTVVDHDLPPQVTEITAYPKSGTRNPTVSLHVVDIADGAPREVSLAAYTGADILISGVGWGAGDGPMFFYVQDRIQTWLDFMILPRGATEPRKLFRMQAGAWTEPPLDPHFFDDGSMLLTSEESGFRHLYRHAADGTRQATLTTGAWEVREIHHVGDLWVYFTGTRDSEIAANLYRVPVAGGTIERLTWRPGNHRINFSPNGRYFIDTHSSVSRPPQVHLHSADGTELRDIDLNPVEALQRYRVRPHEHHVITTPDGVGLHALVLLPPDFDARHTYPVWFMTYAGPHAPTVGDSWSTRRMIDQLLAEAGIIVLRCDPRSASGRGAESAWTAYRQLGVGELQDIRTAIEWLKAKPYVDGARIGMSGHSYGGYMTAYAMTHSDLFCAGIAGAPVTDWRNYDTIYTERYMSTPQDNADGYSVSSVIEAAADLHGRLLILHGAKDDNVHLSNTLQLVDALQKADKDFELMIYPRARHGLFGRHYNRLRLEFIKRMLLEQ